MTFAPIMPKQQIKLLELERDVAFGMVRSKYAELTQLKELARKCHAACYELIDRTFEQSSNGKEVVGLRGKALKSLRALDDALMEDK